MDTKRKFPSRLAGVPIGAGHPARLMGVINISPESFYKGSVPLSNKALVRLVEAMDRDGADFLDVGAMSTAPYLKTEISEAEEARRLKKAVQLIRSVTDKPISIDTSRRGPAEAGFEAGASILNDVTGLAKDPGLAGVARQARGVVLMAHPMALKNPTSGTPVSTVADALKISLRRAVEAGVSRQKIVLDPGIGFFRNQKLPWWKWDLLVLRHLTGLKRLGYPLLVGVSRKSFLGHLLGGVPAEERLPASLAATVFAALQGASVIRTHDVKPTRQALEIAHALALTSR